MEEIQGRVINFLKNLSNDLQIAAKDQCSEVARLVGYWILDEHPEYKVQICKGELSDGLAHDILVINDGKTLSLIDPTIWQIFPESKDIFVGSVDNMQEALSLLNERYNGSWKTSEDLYKCGDDSQKKLLAIIKNNRQERKSAMRNKNKE